MARVNHGGGELLPRIRHVFSAKHSKLQHFLGRQFRAKLRMEISANGGYPFVPVTALHAIVDDNGLPSSSFHPASDPPSPAASLRLTRDKDRAFRRTLRLWKGQWKRVNNERRLISTREHSIATWCKRFQIDLWNLHDRMKAGELILYEKRGEDEVNVTHSAMNKIKELISGIERALLDE